VDASRIVGFHTRGYTHGWESSIMEVRRQVEKSSDFAEALKHYTSNAVDLMNERTPALQAASKLLHKATDDIAADLRTLRRYVSPIYRLRTAVSRRGVSEE
jgi:uncharacterized phage infection (PIP) family protein YhgE